MKVVAINGSPHENGNTAFAIDMVVKELKTNGIDVEVLHIGNDIISGCKACGGCMKNRNEKCVLPNDNINEYIQKMKNADGIILGSPVHYSGMAATMKAFLDRAFYVAGVNGSLFRHKVGVSVVAVRRSGGVATFEQLNKFINYSEMVMPASNYWNVIHGRVEGEAQNDLEGVQIMRVLGKNMAWVMKLIENGKDKVDEPEAEGKIVTNFIR